jgi:hypothetical protein
VLDIIDRIICEELHINVPFSNNCKKDVDTVITLSYPTHMEPSIMRGRGRRRKMENTLNDLLDIYQERLEDIYADRENPAGHVKSLKEWILGYPQVEGFAEFEWDHLVRVRPATQEELKDDKFFDYYDESGKVATYWVEA